MLFVSPFPSTCPFDLPGALYNTLMPCRKSLPDPGLHCLGGLIPSRTTLSWRINTVYRGCVSWGGTQPILGRCPNLTASKQLNGGG